MFEGLRDSFANGLDILARRIGTDPRYPDASRVPSSGRSLAGVFITPDNAVTLPAMWRGLQFLAQTTGVLPWRVLREGKRGAEIAKTHTVDWLLWKRPSKEWSSFQFRETLIHWALRWGNGYAEIEPDQLGRPYAMWPIHPERVHVCRAIASEVDAYGEGIETGDLYYEVDQGSGAKLILSQRRMFHIRGFGEGPVGVNVMHYAAESLGWAKAVQLFGSSFFGNGTNISAVVMNKKPLKPDGLRRQRQEFSNLYGGPRKANRTAHLDNDADIKLLGLDAEKSQLNETDAQRVLDVCRWIGVPPHKVMDLSRATFSNIEHQATEVVVDSISPWVKRFEDEADAKLFGEQNRQGFYSKVNMKGLLRGDTAARIAFYKGMWEMGAYSPNDVLEHEDEETLGDAGDIHVMQGQYQTIEQVKEGRNAPQPPPNGTAPPSPEDEPAAQEAVARIARLLEPVHV